MPRLRMSVRGRLTALYGGLFLLVGLVLLVINYLLVRGTLPDATRLAIKAVPAMAVGATADTTVAATAEATRTIVTTSLDDYRTSVLTSLVIQSSIALLIAVVLAVLFGWVMARRALRPLHAITATARKLEAEDMHRRINLDGPEDELKELADTFDSMLDRLAVSFDSQKRFVANASHELRTPLAVQRTLIEVALADPEVRPEVVKLGAHLLHTNERSERMIEGLLVLARGDRGLTRRTPIRLDNVARSVLRSSSALAEKHGVTLEPDLRARTVAGDKVLLERLVTNLVQNAISYNQPGGSVRLQVGDTLVVTNSGPVVPADAVEDLFEPFRRLTPDRTASSSNAGLGLSIVRSVAQAHSGTVRAEARASGGLVVTVRLPD
ncbi:MAG: two-component system histidine kinase [Amycolatopsis sp.]|uniref:ATP-binding protein n=1 Tax=Amycolatopsis sp. TaxID=37632 RepID=UPI002630237B|nr:ATP-binding protein [Amycolatopsis sp.]MCU1684886.1 two-component system histidine kinase [Amycolatopsis sp.]